MSDQTPNEDPRAKEKAELDTEITRLKETYATYDDKLREAALNPNGPSQDTVINYFRGLSNKIHELETRRRGLGK